jgi:hypothetical protein
MGNSIFHGSLAKDIGNSIFHGSLAKDMGNSIFHNAFNPTNYASHK